MAKFLFVYRSDKNTLEMPPEDLRRFHDKWRSWMAEGKQKRWMLDAGTALKTEGALSTRRRGWKGVPGLR